MSLTTVQLETVDVRLSTVRSALDHKTAAQVGNYTVVSPVTGADVIIIITVPEITAASGTLATALTALKSYVAALVP